MKKAIIAVAALAAVLALGGCSASNTPAQNSSSGGSSGSASSEAASTQGTANDSKAQNAATEQKASEPAKTKEEKKSSKKDEGSGLSKSKVEKIIESNGYGDIIDMEESKLSDGVWYWLVTTSVDDGSVHQYKVDPKGTVTPNDEDTGKTAATGTETVKNELSKADVEDIIFQQGLGEVVSAEKVTRDDGLQYWEVVTRGADGKKVTFMIDPDGNVSEK